MSKEKENIEEGSNDPNQLELGIELDTDPSYWNYRVLKYKAENGSDAFGVHEAQYNVKGDIIQIGEFPVEIFGTSLKDLEEGIDKVKDALSKDIIDTDEMEAND
jgi:hypothetical protein